AAAGTHASGNRPAAAHRAEARCEQSGLRRAARASGDRCAGAPRGRVHNVSQGGTREMGGHRAQEWTEAGMTRWLIAACLACAAAGASAQAFPSRAIHFAVAFSPGGIADTIARSVGQKMSEKVGQPVVVETKSGAGGLVGAKYVAAAAPDGYTLLVTTTALAINANTKEGVPLADLTPIAIAASTPT